MRVIVLLVSGLAAVAAGATTVEIETYWVPEGHNSFSFHSGDRELCRFSGRAPADTNSIIEVCRFELPADATAITVRGEFTRMVWDRHTRMSNHRSSQGERTVRLRDGSALTRPLRDAHLPLAERWRRAVEAERTLVESWGRYEIVTLAEPSSAAQVAAAEKTLGFALPAGYRELVTKVGVVTFGDHGVLAPELLLTADRTILKQWSYGDSGIPAWLAPAALERLRRSVLLFLEVGDGVGAQLFLAPPNAACDKGFATMFFHEDSVDDAMADLAADRLVCTSFEDALFALYERFVVFEHAASLAGETGELLIDRSAAVQHFNLRYGTDKAGTFEVDLSPE